MICLQSRSFITPAESFLSHSRRHSAHFWMSRRESIKITVFGILSGVGNPSVLACKRMKNRLVNLFFVRGGIVSTIKLIFCLLTEDLKKLQVGWKPCIFLSKSTVVWAKG